MRRRRGLVVVVAAALACPAIAAVPAQDADEPLSLNCDALSYTGALDAATSKEIEPIHSLDGVAAVFKRRGISYQRERGRVTMSIPPAIRDQINGLPAGEPIVLPRSEGGVVCVIVPSADSI